ncbi:MAG: DNA polymerase III subunit gamma/tau [Alphaproteobacteria bacterium]|nr:MAG: DNA polymerase III subunit gamma/tau [Alphaproteobacteria bacterium]
MAKKKQAVEQGKSDNGGEKSAPYVVLARKYRPSSFEGLIGQDAMVTTLKNAFATDRIAQGYMLTGVRGVGKTTTARILSRALNYERDGVDKPTFDMAEFGRHCAEIMEGRHPDVLEMDAASNTGVDNMREIIESARYKPMLARYKVYLIDEVHMLSKGAFNALLKTLEEPPGHVKFIFATTEVRKVPLTVLSRCQRFDLRRVEVPVLMEHFKKIIANEGGEAEDEALAAIARAAEGSVRDGLSLLDQALAMSAGKVRLERVRDMLGLADRGRIFDLLERLLGGATGEALETFAALHRDGAEPGQILADLAEAVHTATRAKTLGATNAGEGLSGEERRRAVALAERLSVAILARAWQLLLKGLDELARAPNQAAAAEMVLIRLAYTADLPAPADIINALGGSAPRAGAKPALPPAEKRPPAPVDALESAAEEEGVSEDDIGPSDPAAAAVPILRTFADVVALVGERREVKLRVHLEEHVSLVRFEPAGSIELHLLPGAPKELANELREKLNAWTDKRWMVALSKAPGAPAIGQAQRERQAAEIRDIAKHPAVAAVLQQFPDAQVTGVRPLPGTTTDDTGTG